MPILTSSRKYPQAARSIRAVISSALVLTLVAIFAGNVRHAVAVDRVAALTSGMGYEEVIRLWGSPLEKVEHESRREEVWRYSDGGSVIFHEGKVAAWSTSRPTLIASTESNATKQVYAIPSGRAGKDQDPAVLQDILSEIMRDPSSGEPDNTPGRVGPLPNAVPVEIQPNVQVQPQPE